ncbi:MAG: arylsulfatase [Verrucomicrobiales bacterium]|nr:arylsulfatase [Verrucomicrobiales bacterium]
MRTIRSVIPLCVALTMIFTHSSATAAETSPPHVIIIMTDDQGGWDYGFMGNKVLDTPNLDAMAKRSAQMTRFYVSPVCTPTRANLMTGRYNYRTRAIDTFIGRAMMDTEEVTIAEVLAPAGYSSGIFGKWHLGDSYPMRPQDQGFDEVLVHRGGGIGQPSDPPGGESKYTDPILQHNGVEKEFKGYCTDIYFKAAMDFIGKNHKQGKPTFTYIPTNPPHGPYGDVPGELLEKYRARDLRPTYLRQPFPDKQYERRKDTTARIFAMIENVDQNVGRLFKHLKKIDAHDNTLVFFLNDNGPNGPRFVGPHRGNKGQIYEGGIRSILLAHWPRSIRAGTTSDAISAHYDLFPTILAAAGAKKPKGLKIDGMSILPHLKGQKVERIDRTLFLQWHRGNEAEPYRNGAAVTQRYKLLWPNFGKFAPKNHGPQLYDLIADPKESKNLAAEKPDLLKRLKRRYDVWFSDVSSTRPNNYDPPRIHIGNPRETTTVLTRQDWRFRGPNGAWGRNDRGHWLVTVERAGLYDVKVLFAEDQHPETLGLEFVAGRSGKVKKSAKVAAKSKQHIFKSVRLKAGPQDVEAFLAQGDRKRGVHQIYITSRESANH